MPPGERLDSVFRRCARPSPLIAAKSEAMGSAFVELASAVFRSVSLSDFLIVRRIVMFVTVLSASGSDVAFRFVGSLFIAKKPPEDIAGGRGGGGGIGAAGKLVRFISVLGMGGGGGMGRVFFSTRASWNLAGVDPARLDVCLLAPC